MDQLDAPACESQVEKVIGGSVGRNPLSRGGHTHKQTHAKQLACSAAVSSHMENGTKDTICARDHPKELKEANLLRC